MQMFEEQEEEIVDAPVSSSKKLIGWGVFSVVDFGVSSETNNNDTHMMDFSLQNDEIGNPIRYRIFVNDEIDTTQAGDKFRHIDKFGNYDEYWKAEPKEMLNTFQPGFYSFDAESARQAFHNEHLFMDIVNAAEVIKQRGKTKDTNELVQRVRRMPEEFIKMLFTGDEDAVKAFKEKIVGKEVMAFVILRVVGEKSYMDFYPKFLVNWSTKADSFFEKKVSYEASKDKSSDLKDAHRWIFQPLGEFNPDDLKSLADDDTAEGNLENNANDPVGGQLPEVPASTSNPAQDLPF